MEFIVEKIGMTRTVTDPIIPVTLVRVLPAKMVKIEGEGRALIAYSRTKKMNKPIAGLQKKYGLSKEFNCFATVATNQTEVGDVDTSALVAGATVQSSFRTKGRGFTGVVKRWNFGGGRMTHGSRFHRTSGSIGNREWPGRVQKGRKMSGQYGNELVSVKNEIVSFDPENGILALKGSVPGYNGAMGRVKVCK
ncbi:MAG: 50S ribosomal protein L3 [Campylobacterales bacterium]